MAQAAAATRPLSWARPTRARLLRQSLASFAAVVACYWVYWLVAVPWIEPSLETRATAKTSEEIIREAREDVTARQREVAQYFAPGDWETDKPAIWQKGQMRLLYKTLEPKPDGTVELRPCTLMFFSKNPGTPAAPTKPIIMRAVEGADIKFDQRIELRNVDIGQRRFESGRLIGPIHIFRHERTPGAADDLEIKTRDVQMQGARAWSENRVDFRLGRSYGSGRDLEILLGAPDGREANVMRNATLQTLKLLHDVRMRLEVAPPALGEAPPSAEPPIEITCQGHFQFDMEVYAASFHKQVNVFRLNPVGESDQLNCELLTAYFARAGESPAQPGQPAKGADKPAGTPTAMQIRLIEARGDPVTLRSHAQALYVHCKGADFVPGPPGMPGSLAAFGPGVIRGNLPNDPAATYVAQWARELRFEPDGPHQRVMLRGATMIRFGAFGTITADEVFAWLSRKPPAAKPAIVPVAHRAQPPTPAAADQWQLERVLARRYPDVNAPSQGDVIVDGPQMHAVAGLLEATVDRTLAAPLAPPGSPATPGQNPRNPAQPRNPHERFEVAGRSVALRLIPQGDQMTIAGATLEQGAQLEQLSTAGGRATRLLLVKGQRLHVVEAHTAATRVTISGNPGYVEAGGMTLWGGAIELEKSTNRLWINGPGRMTMPIAQDLDGQALARPQTLSVDWKERLNFQTDTAEFTGTVVARSSQQMLNTEKLVATLSRPIDFANPNVRPANTAANTAANAAANVAERPELAVLRTFGPTVLEGRQFGEDSQQSSYSRMELADLSVNRATGEIGGRGPGWIKHLARGAPQALFAPEAGAAGKAPPPKEPAKQLTYLFVDFRKGLGGNIDRRSIKLFDHTRTVYGPVADWNDTLDAHDLAGLGPDGMFLEADQLEIREMGKRPGGKRGWFELDATGGVLAEGQRFTAQGKQLTYAEEKDLVILRGDPAEMYLEDSRLSERIEHRADEVRYWLKLNRAVVSRARDINLSLPPGTQQKAPDERKPKPSAPR
jgi:hypothetical protein